MIQTISAVVDTNVLVAARRSKRGASHALIREFFESPGRWIWLLSTACICEYEEQLARLLIDPTEIAAFLDDLADCARPISVPYRLRPLVSDPDDEFMAELAVLGRADYLITFNQEDFAALSRFGTKLASPGEFMHILRGHL